MNGQRFQNYEAYFTILDTKEKGVSRDWIKSLSEDHSASIDVTPGVWKKFFLIMGVVALHNKEVSTAF